MKILFWASRCWLLLQLAQRASCKINFLLHPGSVSPQKQAHQRAHVDREPCGHAESSGMWYLIPKTSSRFFPCQGFSLPEVFFALDPLEKHVFAVSLSAYTCPIRNQEQLTPHQKAPSQTKPRVNLNQKASLHYQIE